MRVEEARKKYRGAQGENEKALFSVCISYAKSKIESAIDSGSKSAQVDCSSKEALLQAQKHFRNLGYTVSRVEYEDGSPEEGNMAGASYYYVTVRGWA